MLRVPQTPFSSPVSSGSYPPASFLDVAVIGAGPAGSAAAYYLNQLSPATPIALYESSSYIGGRSTTIDVLGETIELGASIFVDVNTNLKSAAESFGLKIEDREDFLTDEEATLGIWDGDAFVFRDTGSGYWNLAKLLWKYGLSPYHAKTHVTKTINKFLKLYDMLPFTSLTDAAAELDLLTLTNSTGRDAFKAAKVSDRFLGDVINAATRVNYAQEVNSLHGLMSSVSFVTEDAMSIAGGNWQIFAQMAHRSGAQVKLNSSVASVIKIPNGLWEVCTTTHQCTHYRTVVISTPLSLSNITISPSPSILPVKYVKLHVTILATPLRPSSAFFDGHVVPGTILTTKKPGSPGPAFLSLSVVGKRWIAGTPVPIYKIFSHERMSDIYLSSLFNTTIQSPPHPPADVERHVERDGQFESSSMGRDQNLLGVSFLYRHIWNSYPIGTPASTFDDFEVPFTQPDATTDGDARTDSDATESSASVGGNGGLYYTSGIERFISTMETATLAGRNVAHLVYERHRVMDQVP